MQFKFILLALAAQFAASNALRTFTLNDGTPVDADPKDVVPAFSPDDTPAEHSVNARAVSPKMLFARYCYPNYPVPCQNGNICCASGGACCENRSCINPNTQNCCRYGYYCQKPAQCVLENNGAIACWTA